MRKDHSYVLTAIFLIAACGVLLISGCSQPVKALDKSVTAPQLIVNPETVRVGVAKMKDTNLVFSGSGFEPGDSVFINLLNVPVEGEKQNLSIAAGEVGKDGTFDAKVDLLTKVSDFLRADVGSNEEMETIVIVSRPPMPAGTYTARAVSMLSDKTADCTLVVKGPSLIDRIKDWLGVKLGKIVKKQAETS
jgi:hypothetical protein